MRTPGVEPGLAGWEPTVITTRPCPPNFSEEVVVIENLGMKNGWFLYTSLRSASIVASALPKFSRHMSTSP